MIAKIRSAKKQDMASVFEILKEISDFRPPEEEWEEIWEQFASQAHVHAVVAVEGEKVIGYGTVVIEYKIRGGGLGHIEDIVVHPDHQKAGVGAMIMQELNRIAKEAHCYKLSLACYDQNIPFYEKIGYHQSGFCMKRFL